MGDGPWIEVESAAVKEDGGAEAISVSGRSLRGVVAGMSMFLAHHARY